jgi:drug/metabolite transporter (DMT)-like permease
MSEAALGPAAAAAAVVPVARTPRDTAADTVKGIGIVALAYFVMTTGDIAAKWAMPVAGVAGIMVWRGVFGAAFVLGFASFSRKAGPYRWWRVVPNRRGLVFLRSSLGAFSSLCWYLAWRSMSLADTYAVGFTAPLLMTLLAIPILGERIRWRRALSTAVGFAGVLIMVRPGGDLWTPTLALLMLGILAMSINRIMTRLLATTETPECLAFWLLLCHIVPGVVLLLTLFPAPGAWTGGTWLVLAFLGCTNGLAHCLHARGYGLAPVSALAPYEYTMLLWGGLLGWLVFGDVPSWSTLAGAAVVAAAGLYNLNRERVLRERERLAAG